MNDNDYSQRYEAVKDFMTKKGNDYLRMVEKTERALMICLGKDFIKTIKAEEILHEILGDLIDGTRAWDMEKYSVKQIIYRNLRSEINNLVKKEKRYIIPKDVPHDENEEDERNNGMDTLIHTNAEDIEGKIDAEVMLNYCVTTILKGDEDAQIILNEMLEGKKQKQIAEYLGIPIETAEVYIRKIRRKIRAELPPYFRKNIPPNLFS